MAAPVPKTQLPPLDIGEGLEGLFNEVRTGTAYLNAAKSLAKASKSHPVIMRVSPSFFSLTTHAHLEAAQLCAARLFDAQDDCAGIPWLLKQAKHRGKEFMHSTAGELDDAIKKAELVCASKAPVLTALKHRRDRWLAHRDKRTIKDRAQFEKDAELWYSEVEELFASANEILNVFAAGHLVFGEDYDDLLHTLDLVEKGVQANAQELEKRIGPCPDEVSGTF